MNKIYIDLKKRRKEKKIKSVDELAKMMLRKGPIITPRGKFEWDTSNLEDKGYRSLGNRIRELENSDFSWWKNNENIETLKRLAEILEISVSEISLEDKELKKKRLFYWEELPDLKPFDPLEETIANIGLRLDLFNLEQKKIWYVIPPGWGKKILTHVYLWNLDILVIKTNSFNEAAAKISEAQRQNRHVLVYLDTPVIDSSENFNNLEFKNHLRVVIFSPFLLDFKQNTDWYYLNFESRPEWMEEFIFWICSRLPANSKIEVNDLIRLISTDEVKREKFNSPEALLPIIEFCFRKGIKECRNFLRKENWYQELILIKTKNNQTLKDIFINVTKKFIGDSRYFLNEGLSEEEWEKLIKSVTKSSQVKSSEILKELQKAKLLLGDLKLERLKPLTGCLDEIAKEELKHIVTETNQSFGQLLLDPSRQKYIKDILVNLKSQEKWESILKSVLERFQEKEIRCIAEIECLFTVAASRWYEYNEIPKNKKSYQQLLIYQINSIFKYFPNSEPAGPLTIFYVNNSNYGAQWIGDCWLWDLHIVFPKEIDLKKITFLFPIHGNLLNKKEWLSHLNNILLAETPRRKEISSLKLLDSLKEYEAQLTEQNNSWSLSTDLNYERLIELSIELVKRLKLSLEDAENSCLFFPTCLLEEFFHSKEIDISTMRNFKYLVNLNVGFWDENLLYLVKKYYSNILKDFATSLFKAYLEIVPKYGNNSVSFGFINFISTLYKNRSFKLLHFFEENVDFIKCYDVIVKTLPKEWDHSYNELPLNWEKILLEAFIANPEGKNILINSLDRFTGFSRKHPLLSHTERKYWKAILDEIDDFWYIIQILWKKFPDLALSQAKLRFKENPEKATNWFSSAPDSQIPSVCREFLKFRKENQTKLPYWCKRWIAGLFRHPSARPFLQELYLEFIGISQ